MAYTRVLLYNVGIALAIIGVPMGMYCNYLFPKIQWSPVFMTISVILIFSYNNLLKLRFPSVNKYLVYAFLYQSLMLLYGVFSGAMTFQYFSFHLFLMFFILSLSTNKLITIDEFTITTVFYLSLPLSIFGATFLYNGLITGEVAWELRQENEKYALEIFTVSSGAIINLIAALFQIRKGNNVKSTIAIFFVLIDLYIIIFGGKRTPLFVSLIALILYLFGLVRWDFKKIGTYIFLGFLILATVISFTPTLRDVLSSQIEDLYNGVQVLFGNTSVSDRSGSSLMRVINRDWTYNYIEFRFDFFNYIFGAGYMTKWIDNPLLQSFLDMGTIGFLFYFYFILYFPISSIRKAKGDRIIYFGTLLCLYNLVSVLNSGNPYLQIKHSPYIILAYVIGRRGSIYRNVK